MPPPTDQDDECRALRTRFGRSFSRAHDAAKVRWPERSSSSSRRHRYGLAGEISTTWGPFLGAPGGPGFIQAEASLSRAEIEMRDDHTPEKRATAFNVRSPGCGAGRIRAPGAGSAPRAWRGCSRCGCARSECLYEAAWLSQGRRGPRRALAAPPSLAG